jgi:hypothetical protein
LLARVRAVAATRWLFAIVATVPLLMTSGVARSADAPHAACTEGFYRQFDFWLGEWDVYAPDGSKAGRNTITSIAAGCALAESWTGRSGFTGRSLNIFDKADGKWHQTWVDSAGGRLDLAGALEGSAMVLGGTGPDTDQPGRTLVHRITWTPNSDGSVRQHWQASSDGGTTWSTVFDGRYVRKKR